MMEDAPNVTPHPEHPKASADRLLPLAAAPTFATMALFTGIHDGNMPGMLCSAAQDASPLVGMVPMYLLMSAFHSGPWQKLILAWAPPGGNLERRAGRTPARGHSCRRCSVRAMWAPRTSSERH